MIHEENFPEDLKDSFIINCYKGKGDATNRGNCRTLKLLEHVIKVLKRVLENFMQSQVDINNMQLCFMPGRTTTYTIYILWQIQEKYLIVKKKIYFAFAELGPLFRPLVGYEGAGN